jgi:hypothetical protein
VDACPGFNVLSQEFGEDYLLGEEFRTDGDMGLGGAAAGKREEGEKKKQIEKWAAHRYKCLMLRREHEAKRSKSKKTITQTR